MRSLAPRREHPILARRPAASWLKPRACTREAPKFAVAVNEALSCRRCLSLKVFLPAGILPDAVNEGLPRDVSPASASISARRTAWSRSPTPTGASRRAAGRPRRGQTSTFRTALTFWREGREVAHVAGPEAVARAANPVGDQRFVQSLKTHLASRAFAETRLYGRRFTIEDLIATFLRDLAPGAPQGADRRRPALSSSPAPTRTRTSPPRGSTAAYAEAGMPMIALAYEPLGAAYWYARALERDETVLVADFGGGTSDFSVLRFTRAGRPAGGDAARPFRRRHRRRHVRLPHHRPCRGAPPRQGGDLPLVREGAADPGLHPRLVRAMAPALLAQVRQYARPSCASWPRPARAATSSRR